jgi:DNA-binding NtrC family response regulator
MIESDISRRRILVVEDETLIAMEIQVTLEDLGCEVIGPVGKLETALELARETTPDAAILDVTIRGGKSYPVANELIRRNIPFALATGYGDRALPEAMRDFPRLTKPFTMADLEKQVRLLCDEGTRRNTASIAD